MQPGESMNNLIDRETQARLIAVKLVLCKFGTEVAREALDALTRPDLSLREGMLGVLVTKYAYQVITELDRVEIERMERNLLERRSNANE